MTQKRTLLCALALSTALSSGVALAQDEGENDRITTGIDTITVTAQKRTENLQDVPLAVSALNEKQIEDRYGRDISELGSISPNLIIDPIYGVASPAISLRGIQLNDGEKSFDPAVAVYLDGVYLSTTTGALLNIFNAEAVEVLRGPQNTLFGRNTIGGLVHVRRKEPSGEFSGKVSATYGRFDQIDVRGVVDLPAIANDTISTQLSVVSLNGGGYFHNVTRDEQEGNNNFLMFGGAVKFEPNDRGKLVVRYDYIHDNTNTRPVTSLTEAGEAFCFGAFGPIDGCGQPPSEANFHRSPNTGFVQPQSFRGHSLIANGELEIGEGHSLHTVIGWRDSEESSVQKFDGTQANLFYLIRPQEQDQFSAELRYQGEADRARWILGGYYYDSSYTNRQRTWFFQEFGPNSIPTSATEDEVLALINSNTLSAEVPAFDARQNAQNIAIFGQLEYDIVDNLTLTVGGRYTWEEKDICSGQATGPFDDRTYTITMGACDDFLGNLPVYQAIATNPVTGEMTPQDGRESWNKFTPKVGLDYQFENGLIFASFSQGFRSGGYNGRAVDAFTLGPYDLEEVTNYEAGFKTNFADNRIQFNVTGFWANYKNKQEDVVFPDPVAVTVTVVQNAAKAELKGFEAELLTVPVDGWTVGLNVGHLSSGFEEWNDIGF